MSESQAAKSFKNNTKKNKASKGNKDKNPPEAVKAIIPLESSDVNPSNGPSSSVLRPVSPTWKGIPNANGFEEHAETLKKSGVSNDDLVLETYKGICKHMADLFTKTSVEIGRTVTKLEDKINLLDTKIDDSAISSKMDAEEMALELHYEKMKYATTISIQQCPDKHTAKAVLDYIIGGTCDIDDSWTFGKNRQNMAVRLDSATFQRVIQHKAHKLKEREDYKNITVKAYKGSVELAVTRRLWDKANNLNELENPVFNGKSYDTANGKFAVMSGAIRYVPNKPK